MMTAPARRRRRLPLLIAVAAAGLGACAEDPFPPFPCPTPDPAAVIDPAALAGSYRYASGEFLLSGTITFAAGAEGLSVIRTSYDAGRDRSLAGPGRLAGNRVDLRLSPGNGDADYLAEVALLFTAGGRRFCMLEFADSNGDRGGPGSYFGERR
jgi:hypothetical protein